MDLASCAGPAVVECDDTPQGPTDWLLVALEGVVVLVLLVGAVLLLHAAVARRGPGRPPAQRTWVSADGDVVRQERPLRR